MVVPLSPGSPAPLTPPATNGIISPDPSIEPTNLTTFDVGIFRHYILTLLPPVLGATTEDLENSLFDHDFDERVSKFAIEAGSVVYVLKRREEVTGTLDGSVRTRQFSDRGNFRGCATDILVPSHFPTHVLGKPSCYTRPHQTECRA